MSCFFQKTRFSLQSVPRKCKLEKPFRLIWEKPLPKELGIKISHNIVEMLVLCNIRFNK